VEVGVEVGTAGGVVVGLGREPVPAEIVTSSTKKSEEFGELVVA
jgi:hypothetical protein